MIFAFGYQAWAAAPLEERGHSDPAQGGSS